jgi:hypothetical protein
VFLLGSAFGLWIWLFAQQTPPYGPAMQEIIAIIYASHVVWHFPSGLIPDSMTTAEQFVYQLLGEWLAIIPVASAGAFWLAVRSRRRGRHMKVWGDGFVLNLLIFVLGTVALGAEAVAAVSVSGGNDPFQGQFLWAPVLAAALPYSLLVLLVLALACSGAGTLLAANFARWRPGAQNAKGDYGCIVLVAAVCVAAVVAQAAFFQWIFAASLSDSPLTVFWYPLAATVITVVAAVAMRGPRP